MDIDNRNLVVNITPGSVFKGILVILGLWFLYFIKDIVLVVLLAVVLASAIEPLVLWFNKYKIRRLPAVIVTYIALFSIFAGLFYFFVPSVLNEASDFLSSVPKYLESTTLWNPLNVNQTDVSNSQQVVKNLSESISNPKQFAQTIAENAQLKDNISTNANGSFGIGDLVRSIQSIASNLSEGFVKIVSAVFGGVLSFILIVVISFYLAVQEDGVAKFLQLITPVKREKYVVDLWRRSQRKIGYWMQGQLLLGVLVAVLVYLGLTILGIKNALLLAALTGVLEIIPLFGPIIAAIPAALTGFVDGGVTMGLLVIGLYIIVQQFENHLIYPLVVKKIVGVSPILVILSLIIGAKLAGFMGIVLSVPIISAVMEFVEDLDKRKQLFWQKSEEPKNT
jgi:predicted PurR-regulated permease PerM